MTNDRFILMVVYAVARACGARSMRDLEFGRAQSCGKGGHANVRLGADVYHAGCSWAWGVGGAPQTGPPKYPAGLKNGLFVTPMGPQRDLFGTPFGPLFLIQTDAKHENLPEIRRNRIGGAEVYTKKRVPRRTGSGRRGATPSCRAAFLVPPISQGEGPARRAFLMVPTAALIRCSAGVSVAALSQRHARPRPVRVAHSKVGGGGWRTRGLRGLSSRPTVTVGGDARILSRMIRRHAGKQFFLISQHEHALLAADFGKHYGNAQFARPEPLGLTLEAVAQHDDGWPLHDELPTLNDRGLPLDVFDSLGEFGLQFWTTSVDRASAVDPYVGLLVSLHVLALSMLVIPHTQGADPKALAIKFALNKFQHREVERQELLRRKLGMRTDIPLKLGVAKAGISADEDQLTVNFRFLQAMDVISLALCCTNPPVDTTQDVFPKPGSSPVRLQFHRQADDTLCVKPWPFNRSVIESSVAYRAVSDEPFASQAAFRTAFAAASPERLPVRLIDGGE